MPGKISVMDNVIEGLMTACTFVLLAAALGVLILLSNVSGEAECHIQNKVVREWLITEERAGYE